MTVPSSLTSGPPLSMARALAICFLAVTAIVCGVAVLLKLSVAVSVMVSDPAVLSVSNSVPRS